MVYNIEWAELYCGWMKHPSRNFLKSNRPRIKSYMYIHYLYNLLLDVHIIIARITNREASAIKGCHENFEEYNKRPLKYHQEARKPRGRFNQATSANTLLYMYCTIFVILILQNGMLHPFQAVKNLSSTSLLLYNLHKSCLDLICY